MRKEKLSLSIQHKSTNPLAFNLRKGTSARLQRSFSILSLPHPSRLLASGRCPVEKCPVEQGPVEKCPVEQCPVEKCPVKQCPVEKCPVEQCPAGVRMELVNVIH